MILKPKAIDCDAARSMMFDYVDGALCEADVLRLEAHISDCDACKRELADCRQMLGTVKNSAYSVPSGLCDSVMNKIADMPQENGGLTKSLRFKPWMGALTAVCAALMILVVGRGYIDAGINKADMAEDQAGEYARIDANLFDSPNVPSEAEPSGGTHSDEQHGGETTVTVTTGSFAGFAPNIKKENAENDRYIAEACDSSLLDSILGEITDSEIAVLVCRKSDFEGIIPDAKAITVTLEEMEYERYVIDSNAMVTFTGYLELLEKLSKDYRAAVPADAQFDVCEIYLLIDGEN